MFFIDISFGMAFKNVILYNIIYIILLEVNLHVIILYSNKKNYQLITNILISYKQLQALIIIIFKQQLFILYWSLNFCFDHAYYYLIQIYQFYQNCKSSSLFFYFTIKFPINLYKDDTDTETFVNFDPTPMLLEIWQRFQQRNRLSHATAPWRHIRFSLNPH